MFIKVKVAAGSGNEKVVKTGKDSYKIRVKESPVAGMANRRLLQILSLIYGESESKIRIVKGVFGKKQNFRN